MGCLSKAKGLHAVEAPLCLFIDPTQIPVFQCVEGGGVDLGVGQAGKQEVKLQKKITIERTIIKNNHQLTQATIHQSTSIHFHSFAGVYVHNHFQPHAKQHAKKPPTIDRKCNFGQVWGEICSNKSTENHCAFAQCISSPTPTTGRAEHTAPTS